MLFIVREYFKNYPARKKVAELLVNNGIAIRNSKPYIGDIEISVNSIARAAGVNRKIVYHTIEYIENTYELRSVFERLSPTLSLHNVAPVMGWEVIDIKFKKGRFGCALGELTRVLSEKTCEIRQIIGERELLEENRVLIIVEKPLRMETISEIKNIESVESIMIHTAEKDKEKIVCNYCKVKYCPRKIAPR
ncbi:MAG: regulator of amino acid metabolism, contains ACT domain protein [Euryarchaeota archaeon]|nr:regulator of amino acid metabolism, contains ACT domain protein [Euryarchaeota archaeon]